MMLVPSVIDIENVRGFCNARCIMCGIDSPKVKPGVVMSNQVYEQILHQFRNYAADLKQINLVGMGEPLIDSQVCEKVQLAKRILPDTRMSIITNAALLSPEMTKRILDSACDEVLMSVDSIHKPVYEYIRIRLNFEETMENIKHFIRERDAGKYKTKVLVRMIEQKANFGEWQEYVAYWRKYLSHEAGDMLLLFPVHKWPENETESQAMHIVCPYVFDRISLTAEGMIQLCCVDIGADFYPLGSVLNQDPAAVFGGEIFSMIRDSMTKNHWQELPYCNRCNVPLQREKRLSTALHEGTP